MVPRDGGLHVAPHLAVAGEDELAGHAPGGEPRDRLDQQDLGLLLAQTPDAHAPRCLGQRCRRHRIERRIHAAMDDVDLRPVRVRRPAHELRAPIRADRHDEPGTPHLLAELERLGRVELLRPVDREAVSWPSEDAGEHGDLGRVGAEVGMDMGGPVLAQPRQQPASFGQVGEVIRQRPPGAARHAHREAQRPDESNRRGDHRPERRGSQRDDTVLQDVACPFALLRILRIRNLGIPPAQRDSQHLDAPSLQRLDLAPDEAVAHLGVLIDEVGNADQRG